MTRHERPADQWPDPEPEQQTRLKAVDTVNVRGYFKPGKVWHKPAPEPITPTWVVVLVIIGMAIAYGFVIWALIQGLTR